DMACPRCLLALRHAERLALLRPLDAAAADALHADAQPLHAAVDLALDALQVRHEPALAGAGDLGADAAEVLRLAAVGFLVADDRFLPGRVPRHAQVGFPLPAPGSVRKGPTMGAPRGRTGREGGGRGRGGPLPPQVRLGSPDLLPCRRSARRPAGRRSGT